MSRNAERPRKRANPEASILAGLTPLERTPAQVRKRFRARLEKGATLRPAGNSRRDPSVLLGSRYLPRYELRLFDATFYLTDFKHDDGLGFLISYVVLGEASGRPAKAIYPRIFYKDSSLIWRVASHFIHSAEEYWIGKGDVRTEIWDGEEYIVSVEETTDLPFEMQFALDDVSRRRARVRDDDAIELILRQGNSQRTAPYADFTRPRRAAAALYAINGARPVARFGRSGDPGSLIFTRGFEPDFSRGLLEQSSAESRFFGGTLRKYRILSVNRQIQYLFFATPDHAWLTHPQALSSELSSYGVRTVDVLAPNDLAIPGYEYHADTDSQIPSGYAGAPHPKDPNRADASAWLDEMPVIREFRKRILGGKRPKRSN